MGEIKNKNIIKLLQVIGVVLFVLAVGTVGRWDAEYEARPEICREYQGSIVCYQP